MKLWKRFCKWTTVMLTSALVGACGGGGNTGGSGTASTYTTAAAPGELVTYTVDTTALTYSYTITESQYGLTGTTGSGTLTALGNGAYTLSNIANSRIIVLPNGLMMGAIRHDFGTGAQTVPVVGLSNPASSLASVDGTYNYISRGCVSGTCTATYGTLQVNSAGTWNYCQRGNLTAATPACTASGSGNLVAAGSGRFSVYDNGTLVGTVIAMASGGQKVLLMDLKDTRTTLESLGKGFVVASSQVAVNTALTNGSWFAHGSNGYTAAFTTNGANVTYSMVNGATDTSSTTAILESPWTGMGTSTLNLPVLLAGQGVYVAAGNGGYIEVGLKYN